MAKESELANSEEHLRRVRRICASLPETAENLSHGEPTFFAAAQPNPYMSNVY